MTSGSKAKPKAAESTIRFSTELLPSSSAATRKSTLDGSPAFLSLPKAASANLPSSVKNGSMIVEGLINGFPFRAALECSRPPNGKGSHWLKVSEAQRDGAGRAEVGDDITAEITRIGDEPEIRMPIDLRKAMDSSPAAPKLWAVWGDITPMARRDWILWTCSAKQEETRTRRIETACDMLSSGKRRPCCMPGINWRTKDCDITPDETWLPLPKPKRDASARSTK